MTHTTSKPVIHRYSPKPIEAYTKIYKGVSYGPADSPFLKSTEAWNLAFLGHDYDGLPEHPDPRYTVLVDKSLSWRGGTLRRWLREPAPRFVYLFGALSHELVKTLPLYEAFGDPWAKRLMDRSHHAQHPDAPPDPILDEPTGVEDARAYLQKFSLS